MPIFRKNVILLSVLLVVLVLGFGKTVFAEDIILNDLKAKAVNLSIGQGKPTIFLFWTTWCPYCRKEIKALSKMYAQLEKDEVAVFGINIGETNYKVNNFLLENPLNFPILLDKDAKAADKYEVMGVPTYIFMDKTGRVITQTHNLPEDYKKILLE
jgi:peroxiredoxin